MSLDNRPKLGLRERKKMKTRASIQHHALQLFRVQGYNATTIEQISEAAEVSPSTFFRYFPTKEALILEDEYDSVLIRAFQELPSGLNPLQALRETVKSGLSSISKEEREAIRERTELAFSVPELRAAFVNQLTATITMIAELVEDRYDYERNDFHVLIFAGSVIGATLSVQIYCANNRDADFVELIDAALADIEAGLPLPKRA
ncbi:TetR family transcriptional regulator [Paenibacillus sp. HJL G12]|uniref:TetR family transcriptional regulator n=1 Tax=Paenibacillus dendrobii TaxID=2691084 RepID=A0A7X3LFI0_9BACL|nr:TetR family transcriptional regulator [Paenibacillus dendrobii]MWV43027.1 TetR family transcriptional regulator [Paenibacillus dendrobii]